MYESQSISHGTLTLIMRVHEITKSNNSTNTVNKLIIGKKLTNKEGKKRVPQRKEYMQVHTEIRTRPNELEES